MTLCASLPICVPTERTDQIMSLSQLELRITKIFHPFPVPDFQFKHSLSAIDLSTYLQGLYILQSRIGIPN